MLQKVSNVDKTFETRIQDSGSSANMVQRLLVATPTRGLVRMEWVAARYNQLIPTNWSKTDMIQYLNSFIPLRYTVADAQNLAVREAIERGFEWLMLIEDDTMPPPDALFQFTEYMDSDEIPVVSGLYFTRSVPPEPMIYRGRGNHYYRDWKLGDKVWCDGVPTGMLLLSVRLLKAVYEESAEYMTRDGQKARRVFETPTKTWFNEISGAQETLVGTSDLDFCNRIMRENFMEKAGYPEIAKKKHPYLVDTNIFARHIEQDGTQYPIKFPEQFLPDEYGARQELIKRYGLTT